MRSRDHGVLGVLCAAVVSLVPIQSLYAQDDEAWSRLFGEGMRAWAESDYDRALEMLYQSYALRPTSYNLSLIVRSHDFLGECAAVERQLGEFRLLYKKSDLPTVQICRESGTLVVSCPGGAVGARVFVDARDRGECGDTLELPAGQHTVSIPDLKHTSEVTVIKSEEVRLEVSKDTPSKSPARPHVSKLLSTADRYTIFMTPDGLYQIWVLSDTPDLLPPYEGNLCTRSESEGKASCQPLTKTQRDELEKVAPMILLLPD